MLVVKSLEAFLLNFEDLRKEAVDYKERVERERAAKSLEQRLQEAKGNGEVDIVVASP